MQKKSGCLLRPLKSMKEIECIEKLRDIATKVFGNTGVLEIKPIKVQFKENLSYPSSNNLIPDFEIQVKMKDGRECTIFFEVKSIGQPRYVRMAINQLQAILSQRKNVYGVVGAPYLTEETMIICRENDMGCIDCCKGFWRSSFFCDERDGTLRTIPLPVHPCHFQRIIKISLYQN